MTSYLCPFHSTSKSLLTPTKLMTLRFGPSTLNERGGERIINLIAYYHNYETWFALDRCMKIACMCHRLNLISGQNDYKLGWVVISLCLVFIIINRYQELTQIWVKIIWPETKFTCNMCANWDCSVSEHTAVMPLLHVLGWGLYPSGRLREI